MNFNILNIVLVFLVVRQTMQQDSQSNGTIAKTLRSLSFKMLQELAKKPTINLLFSPISVATSLGMLCSGARGRTYKQISNLIGPCSEFNKGFKEFLNNNKNEMGMTSTDLAFINEKFNVKPEYISNVNDTFSAGVYSVNLETENEALNSINNMVESHTMGRVNDIITKDMFTPESTMLMTHLNHWKGTVYKPQNKGLITADLDEPFVFAVELPFENNTRHTLLILFPKDREMSQLKSTLNPTIFLNIMDQLEEDKFVTLFYPFSYKDRIALPGILKKFGVEDVFSSTSNLSGISDDSISVSNIIHEASVDLSKHFTLDTFEEDVEIANIGIPFLLMIIDKEYNVPIFVGEFTEPLIY